MCRTTHAKMILYIHMILMDRSDMKILVCGGRNYNDKKRVFDYLDYLSSISNEKLIIIQGGAPGADKLAKEWAISRQKQFKEFPADWNTYGKRAGYIRNQQMADDNPDIVVAFPGGVGTQSMITIAYKMKIPVILIGTDLNEELKINHHRIR